MAFEWVEEIRLKSPGLGILNRRAVSMGSSSGPCFLLFVGPADCTLAPLSVQVLFGCPVNPCTNTILQDVSFFAESEGRQRVARFDSKTRHVLDLGIWAFIQQREALLVNRSLVSHDRYGGAETTAACIELESLCSGHTVRD